MNKCLALVACLVFLNLPAQEGPHRLQPREVASPDVLVRSYLLTTEGLGWAAPTQPRSTAKDAALAQATQEARTRLKHFLLRRVSPGSLDAAVARALQDAPVIPLEDPEGRAKWTERADGVQVTCRFQVEVRPDPVLLKAILAGQRSQVFMDVNIETDQRVYLQGASIQVRLHSNRPCYGRLLYLDASGHLLQVLPNIYRPAANLAPGKDLLVPSSDDQFRLEVAPPFGNESFILLASTRPMGELPLGRRGAVYSVSTSLEGAGNLSRGLRPQQAEDPDEVAEFIELHHGISTRGRD